MSRLTKYLESLMTKSDSVKDSQTTQFLLSYTGFRNWSKRPFS